MVPVLSQCTPVAVVILEHAVTAIVAAGSSAQRVTAGNSKDAEGTELGNKSSKYSIGIKLGCFVVLNVAGS
ncbi:hypothetical protein BDR26DRAFT_856579 [Obelidium mucronatum]|nr:hypothetical protein BDR26DRAFT_856579 [Obelidium mucronatum]